MRLGAPHAWPSVSRRRPHSRRQPCTWESTACRAKAQWDPDLFDVSISPNSLAGSLSALQCHHSVHYLSPARLPSWLSPPLAASWTPPQPPLPREPVTQFRPLRCWGCLLSDSRNLGSCG